MHESLEVLRKFEASKTFVLGCELSSECGSDSTELKRDGLLEMRSTLLWQRQGHNSKSAILDNWLGASVAEI